MKAVLLAAGRGTRLAPLTDTVPKILAPVSGRPLLGRQLSYLASHGVREVAINLHHHHRQVAAFLAGRDWPLRVHVYVERRLLGTAGALLPMRSLLDEPFLVLYGDVLTDADVASMLARHRSGAALATLAYYAADEIASKGLLRLGPDGAVVSFVEKPQTPAAPALVSAGLYALDPAVLDFVTGGTPDFGHDVWPRMLAAGARLEGFRLDGYLRDIGSPQALLQASRDVAAGRVHE